MKRSEIDGYLVDTLWLVVGPFLCRLNPCGRRFAGVNRCAVWSKAGVGGIAGKHRPWWHLHISIDGAKPWKSTF